MFRPSRWFGWNRSSSADGVRSPPGRHNTPTIANVPNPHSLEHLKTLHAVMDENKVVSEENRTLLVETLRQIAEILIWGDQNDSTVFDFFLEKNMLYFFLQIMKQKCGGYVCTQLLQTLNILFENIRNETSLYYLLSNNHVNSIIVHKFDFDDEEVMAYYISFLKTLSLKLNNHTVHFFFNEHTADFPLYTEAIKFFNHSEKMVRIAVRTLTLNVFRVRENAMLRFIRDCTAAPYFGNLSWFIGKHVVDIEQSLASYIANRYNSTASAHSGQNLLIRLEDLIAEHLDHLHYLNDILLLNIDDLNSVLSDNLLHRLIVPLYLHSFLRLLHRRSHRPLKRLSQLDSTLPADSSTGEAQESTSLSPSVALFLLTQAYIIFSYRPLLNTLVNFLLRSNQVDIELNAKRCEFTPPEASLEQAIEQAISSSAIVASSSNPHSATSSPAHSTNAAGAQVQVQPDGEAAIASTANTTEVQTQLPYAQPASPVHGSPVPMEVDSAVLPGPVMTISNWPEYPFLIALLSALNSSITSSNGAAAAEAEPPTSTSRTTRSRENSSSESSSTNRAVGGSNPLSKSCHSPIVTRSIVELTNPDDRVILFTLSLITSILSNKAIDLANYRGVFVPPSADSSPSDSEATNSYCSALINSLLLIMRQCSSTNSSVRIVTFELAVYLFKRVVFYHHYLELSQSPCPKSLPIFLSDHQLAVLEQANEDAAHMLRTYFRSTDESVFLELFEQEAEIAAAAPSSDEREQLLQKRHDKIWSHNLHLNLEQLFMDSTLMLPPDEINPSAFDSNFYLRLPMNEYERTRYAIKVFFILRRLSEDVRVVSATEATENMLLPEKQADPLRVLLESTETTKIALDQFLDLENSDLNSCSIRFFYPLNQNRLNVDQRNRRNYSAPGSRTDSPSIVTTRKMSRFMVITAEHVILIEPDTKHYGWGVIRFIARLQDLEFWSHAHALNQPCTPAIRKEKDDVQSILVHFRRYQLSSSMMDSSHLRAPSGSIVVRFSFDDQIRCYAAKQHLTKAQSKVHDRKISAIVRLIDLNSFEGSSTRASDQPPPSAETSRATSAKSARANDARKKASQHQHPLLSRSLAVPGGAVLSTHTSPPPADVSGLNSALAKFEMLNKSKVAYPAAKAKSSKTTADGEVKRKKKLKNPNALLPEQEQDGIPLNDLSPKTVRRLVEHGEAKEATVTEHPLGESSSASEPLRSSQHRRNVTQTETIDI